MAKREGTTVNIFKDHGPSGFAAFVAFVGAFAYFARDAHNFSGYVNAFIDAIVWPGIVVYHVLRVLGA